MKTRKLLLGISLILCPYLYLNALQTYKPNTIPVINFDVDTDGDGVNDKFDKCPNTPAGVVVDPAGCPIPDIWENEDDDKDGVVNNIDLCPNSPTGAPVNSNGCPI